MFRTIIPYSLFPLHALADSTFFLFCGFKHLFEASIFRISPSTIQDFSQGEASRLGSPYGLALGAVVPKILDLVRVFHFAEPVCCWVGYSKLQGETLDYLGIPSLHLAGGQGAIVIAICQLEDRMQAKKKRMVPGRVARDIADRLLPAWDTPSGIPYNFINLARGNAHNTGWIGDGNSEAA
ncbi:hypothetical protein DITRI_Ditri09bG0100900 [Diplodiscus trichospermus]